MWAILCKSLTANGCRVATDWTPTEASSRPRAEGESNEGVSVVNLNTPMFISFPLPLLVFIVAFYGDIFF